MIPARLKLENFMCFSDIELDFSGLKMACLTGPNGSGKSSLLDAITWTLWEQARSNSDKLIKIGNSTMHVDLEFIVDKVRYRVSRYYQLPSSVKSRRSAKTSLELFYYDKKRKTWQPYSEKNIKETQDKINKIIKMDYDAFINSVYIRQGNADYFLTKSPEERKRVLAEILGLGEYQRLYAKSLEKAESLQLKAQVVKEQINEAEIKQFSLKKYKNEKEELLLKINTTQDKLSVLITENNQIKTHQNHYDVLIEQQKLYTNISNKYKDDIVTVSEYIDKINKALCEYKNILVLDEVVKQQYSNLLELKEKAKELDQKELDYHRLKDTLIEQGSQTLVQRYSAAQEYQKISQQLQEKLQELEYFRQIVYQEEKINQKYIEYKDVTEKINNILSFKEERARLELEVAKIQNVIDKFTVEYLSEIHSLESEIEELQYQIDKKNEILEMINFIEDEIKQYDKYDIELEKVREKGIKQKDIIFDKTNQNAFIQKDLEKLKEKIDLLQENSKNKSCPTCSGNVVNTDDLIRKLEFDIDNLIIKMEVHENDISIAEDEMKALRLDYKEKKKYISKRSNYHFQLAELKADLKNIEILEQKLKNNTERLVVLKNKVDNASYAHEERVQQNSIKERIEKINNIVENYDELLIRQKELTFIEKRYQELQQAKEKVSLIEKELPFFTMTKRTLEKELQKNKDHNANKLSEDIYSKLLELNYNLEQHIMLRQEIAASQQIEYDYMKLQFAYQQVPYLESNLDYFQNTVDSYYIELEKVNNVYDNVKKQILNYDNLSHRLKEIDLEVVEYNNTLNKCNCDLAVVNDRINAVEDVLAATKDKRKEYEKLTRDIGHYIELANAFGEKGIQDIIIENSLPEIESEANEFLSKLSNNQMRISLKSSKNNKTGNFNDRLDIYVADNQGTKSYELYSGGEAFMINFAIRIALAKLLARSRDVKLQSLIIDDAFASLDIVGKDKLGQIINSVRKDFDLILLVSHDLELMKAFKSKIVLTKEAGTSHVRVSA